MPSARSANSIASVPDPTPTAYGTPTAAANSSSKACPSLPSTNQPLSRTRASAASRSCRSSATPRPRSLNGIADGDGTAAESTDCHTFGVPRRRALITGIGGQDGSFLAELLLGHGYEVFGVVRRAPSERYENLEPIREQIELIQADLLDEHSLVDALKTC